MQLRRERQGLLQKALCSPGEPVTPGCTNPACYHPQHLHTGCCAGPNVQEEFVVSGLGPLSGQRVLGPFQTLPLDSKQHWLCRWVKCEGGPVSSGVSSEFPQTPYLIKFLAIGWLLP